MLPLKFMLPVLIMTQPQINTPQLYRMDVIDFIITKFTLNTPYNTSSITILLLYDNTMQPIRIKGAIETLESTREQWLTMD